ncbi:hypothetical protein B0A54_06104 [Friedmanniomyces endolithicus]|uniref:Uncharacterized protein n=1 Tax=Friedmanniomyces endolithicus TaxID=329885 RepID=A0A4U0V5U6_9PEZI|nr:hypothetical protein LTS09_006808 [Friedmanniomyces endolithicus]KAK0304367.1 hypothetical protein LTR01_007468 [Friedmanniomyces endolithicus]KAK0833618.1 hypothetical protein LTR73_001381 [Friedmanniomyces endolithicus]TKA43155.1 hypothetical protein B0A54_06104 [Friedmanniomyces endolithicus]
MPTLPLPAPTPLPQHRRLRATAPNPANTRPKIVLLSLAKQPWFDESYSPLLTLLKSKADVTEVTDRDEAYDLLTLANPTTPGIILATDQALTEPKYTTLQRKAVDYVRHHGGTLILMALFSSFARPPNIKTLFQAFGLPWVSGDYHRTEFHVNTAATHVRTEGLVPSYSQKALHLAHVEPGDAVYLPSAASRTQSMVFAPHTVDTAQTPAVLGTCGRGKVGYTGDVNHEEPTNLVVLAMCGLTG